MKIEATIFKNNDEFSSLMYLMLLTKCYMKLDVYIYSYSSIVKEDHLGVSRKKQ